MQGIIQFFQGLFTLNGHFDWSVVKGYLFDSTIIQGAEITLFLAIIAQITGSLVGLLLYLLRRSRNGILRGIGEGYVLLFRGTPLLVQLLFLYNLFPYLGLVKTLNTHDFFPAFGFQYVALVNFLPSFIAFSLNEGAYMAEIVRAGIDSIDVGQMEASKSLGMTYTQAMRRIILPQAARVILPPLGNEFNSMLKTTSLASTIGLLELYQAGFEIGHALFKPLELALVIALWYLLMTTIWGFFQQLIERQLNLSNIEPGSPVSLWDRMLGRGNKTAPTVVANDILMTGGRR